MIGLPPLPRCRHQCGRYVWYFDTGCCALCDTKPRPGAQARGGRDHQPSRRRRAGELPPVDREAELELLSLGRRR